MNPRIALFIASLSVLAACGNRQPDSQDTEDRTEASDENVFNPIPGMSLSRLCDVPGISWATDTVYGVCVPDSLVLWAVYGDRWLPTNVRGAENDFAGLTEHGLAAIKADPESPTFISADFTPWANLLDNLQYSRAQLRHDSDSLMSKRIVEMMGAASDFFNSYGMTKYMSKPMADKWHRIQAEARANGVEAPNPINGCNIIEFEPGSVAVTVDNARTGEIRVRAYCRDSHTLGYPGWAIWSLKMCREDRHFKVMTPPILVKPGNDAFSIELYDYDDY